MQKKEPDPKQDHGATDTARDPYVVMAQFCVPKKKIYNHYVFNENYPDRPLMPVEVFKKDKNVVPVTILSASKAKYEKLKSDLFFRGEPRYIVMPNVAVLCNMITALPLKYRNFATMVLWDQGCHVYFDIDYDSPGGELPDQLRDRTAVIDAIWTFFSASFRHKFGREPRGMQQDPKNGHHRVEFDSTQGGKFSLHLHNPCEGFLNVDELKVFVQDHMIPSIREAAIAGDPKAIHLTFWQSEEPKTHKKLYPRVEGKGYWRTFLDPTVYTQGRVFRYPDNCKPGGPALKLVGAPMKYRDLFDRILATTISKCLPPPSELLNCTGKEYQTGDAKEEGPAGKRLKVENGTAATRNSGNNGKGARPKVVMERKGGEDDAAKRRKQREEDRLKRVQREEDTTSAPKGGKTRVADPEARVLTLTYFNRAISAQSEYDGSRVTRPDWDALSSKGYGNVKVDVPGRIAVLKYLNASVHKAYPQVKVVAFETKSLKRDDISVFSMDRFSIVGRAKVSGCVWRRTGKKTDHADCLECTWQFSVVLENSFLILRYGCIRTDQYTQWTGADGMQSLAKVFERIPATDRGGLGELFIRASTAVGQPAGSPSPCISQIGKEEEDNDSLDP